MLKNFFEVLTGLYKIEAAEKIEPAKANFRSAEWGGMKLGFGLLVGLISIAVVLIVLARAFPILWPMVVEAGGNVTSMSGSDAGTTTFVAFWPVVLLIVGIGLAIGLIFLALKAFGVVGS